MIHIIIATPLFLREQTQTYKLLLTEFLERVLLPFCDNVLARAPFILFFPVQSPFLNRVQTRRSGRPIKIIVIRCKFLGNGRLALASTSGDSFFCRERRQSYENVELLPFLLRKYVGPRRGKLKARTASELCLENCKIAIRSGRRFNLP